MEGVPGGGGCLRKGPGAADCKGLRRDFLPPAEVHFTAPRPV